MRLISESPKTQFLGLYRSLGINSLLFNKIRKVIPKQLGENYYNLVW